LAQVGNKREALKILQQLKQQGSETSAMAIVMIYGGLGEKDQAFAWLEKAYLARSNYLAFIKVEPYFDSLRSDPRFTALLEKMRL
ncbi:MAG: hypothetical protein GWN81_16295, partial [Phycisphaerae bacterium]|nr:hypothetical protein [Phycisphaerae bacterium]NIU10374.1 hypothetical protein [Phycisphaerae bacterium]NIW10795.1 hypothetical protein [Gammaproteobacteria bacterium]NIX29928.1 hypothetical protein [Phycisphaerae bacterium]